MSAKTFFVTAFVAIAATAATVAMADDATPDYPVAQPSMVSRAEVVAEYQQARAAGLIAHGDHTPVAPPQGRMLTRAQVRAEALEAIHLHLVGGGERNVFPSAMQLQQIRMAGERALSMNMAAR